MVLKQANERFTTQIVQSSLKLFCEPYRDDGIKKAALSGFSCGEGGIRTPGTLLGVRQFSKLLLSATQAPLQFLKMERKSKKKSVP